MMYSKAYKGIRKLFVAGILSLAGSVCVWLAIIPGILGVSAAINGALGGFLAGGIGTLVFLLAGLLLPVIAYILKLVGLGQASNDDPLFHQGFLFAVLALIFILTETVLTAFNLGTGVVEGIIGTAYGVLDVVVAVYTIYGIQSLAEKLEDYKMVQKGSSLVKYITIFYAASLFATLLSVLFGSSMVMQLLAGFLSFITSILNLIIYIVFLVYLGRTKKMLRNAKESSDPENQKNTGEISGPANMIPAELITE